MLPEQIELFREFFRGRMDDFAEQYYKEDEVSYMPTRRALQDQDVMDHFGGEHTYSYYLIKPGEDNCYSTVIDVDTTNTNVVRKLIETCYAVGLAKEYLLVEYSGCKGYHITIRYQDAVSARKARELGDMIVRLSGIDNDIEVFPKQDKVALGGYGNSIKFPLGKHKKTGFWSHFLDVGLNPIDNWVDHLKNVRRLGEKDLDTIMATHNSVVAKSSDEADSKKMAYAPCVKKVMELGADEGCRNEAMLEIAKDCNRQDYPQDVAITVLVGCNEKNRPPLSDKEICCIVQSVYAKGYTGVSCDKSFLQKHCVQDDCYIYRKRETAVTLPNISSYDVEEVIKASTPTPATRRTLTLDLLPEGFIKDYVNFAYPLTEAPLQYHIATALIIAATVLGRQVYLREGGTTYYPNLYLIIYGSSGIARKSTAINICQNFLSSVDPNYMLSGNMMSMEALLDAFRTSNVHMILYDEFRNLLVNEDKSYGKGLITTFTSLWLCPPRWRIDIKKLPLDERIINAPTLNILAATTPDWLAIKEGDILGGFMGRFLPVYADEKDHRRLAFRPPIDERQEADLINWLRNIKMVSREYTWTDEAKTYFKDIYNSLHNEFAKEQCKAFMQPYWSRIDTHIRKLAMIFDACSPQPTYTITKNNIVIAHTIMEFITECYREMLRRVTFSFQDKKEQQFLELVEKAYPKWVAHSSIMHTLHANAELMKKVVNSLEEKELIETKEVSAPGAKKPKRLYCLRK